jgi:transcriptional regulator with PAS, ATPase and Fis domain
MPEHLDKKLSKHTNLTIPKTKLKASLQNYEKQIIEKVLKTNQWNQTLTAKELDISRRSLVGKIRLYKLTNVQSP